MNQSLWITTSQGVYKYGDGTKLPEIVMKRERRIPFLKKGGFGFFGIALWRDQVVVASRENFSKQKLAKHSEDTQIYAIDPETLEIQSVCKIMGVADVHQIAISGDYCFLTDTGHNQVTVFDLMKNQPCTQLVVGSDRKDVNHINAVTIEGENLYVGLNNRGHRDAQVLSLPLKKVNFEASTNDIYKLAEVMDFDGMTHTHDFEKVSDIWAVCASHQGSVYRALPTQKLCRPGKWVRGLAAGSEGVWIGLSEKLDRKNRHREDVDGEIALWSLDFTEEIKRVALKSAGQVNDLVLL